MPFASGSEVRSALVLESAFGVTPATPAFKTMRVTSGGGRTNKTTGTSDERRADRNVTDEFLLGLGAGGSYEAELTYGTFDDVMQAVLCGTWTSDVLKNGNVPRSFTSEETLELGATDSFFRFPGTTFGKMSLSLSARQKATISFDFMAEREIAATAIVTGATYAAPNTNDVMTASKSVADLDIGGGTPRVMSLSFDVQNNLRERPAVGTLYSAVFGKGRCEVTGTMSVYFESNALYEQAIAHEASSLSFTIGDVTGEKYTIEFPRIKFGDVERNTGGNDEDVMLTLPFRALLDATEGCTIKITRAVA